MANMGSILSFDGVLFSQSLVTVLRMIRFACSLCFFVWRFAILLFIAWCVIFFFLFASLSLLFLLLLLVVWLFVFVHLSFAAGFYVVRMLLWFYGKYCVYMFVLMFRYYNAFSSQWRTALFRSFFCLSIGLNSKILIKIKNYFMLYIY